MHRLEIGHLDPRVDLRRRDRRVTEHRLDVPDVSVPGQQVRRERVPQRVRRHDPLDAGGARVLLQRVQDTERDEPLAVLRQEQSRLGLALPGSVGLAARSESLGIILV